MDNPVLYFDNAATSWPKPPEVARAMSEFLAHDAANPGRAGHRMAVAAEKMLDSVRLSLVQLIGGDSHHRLIFTMNGTDALNIAMKGLLRHGDHVITSTLEHNSVSRPLQAMAEANFITLTRVGFSPATGTIDPDDVKNAINTKTRLVALTHAGNVLGTIQPVEAVGRLTRERGIYFLLDAAQTIGALPIDVARIKADAVAFPGHKSLLGPTGIGGLYLADTVKVEQLAAFREGGTGGDSASPLQPRLYPYFLEGGTPNTVGIAGLGASVRVVREKQADSALVHERRMVQRLIDALAEMPGVTVYGPNGVDAAANRVGTVSFNFEQYSPQEAGGILDESFSIAVRPGLHCAPYAHRGLGTFPDGTVRVSPGVYNTEAQMDTLIDALRQMAS